MREEGREAGREGGGDWCACGQFTDSAGGEWIVVWHSRDEGAAQTLEMLGSGSASSRCILCNIVPLLYYIPVLCIKRTIDGRGIDKYSFTSV